MVGLASNRIHYRLSKFGYDIFSKRRTLPFVGSTVTMQHGRDGELC